MNMEKRKFDQGMVESPYEFGRDKEALRAWLREELDERHEIASLALDFEEYLFSSKNPSKDEFVRKMNLEDLPEYLENHFVDIVERYNKQIERMEDFKEELAFLAEDSDELVKDPERFGEFICRLMDKNFKPNGRVSAEISGGYLFIEFIDKKDYSYFRGKESDSTGSYHPSYCLTDFSRDITVILIRNDADDREQIVTHEKQHFINDSLLSAKTDRPFSSFEPGTKGYLDQEEEDQKLISNVRKGYQLIKDELFAFFREGVDGSNLYGDFVEAGIYDDLLEGFGPKETQNRILIGDIADAYEEIEDKLRGDQDRAIFIYSLVDVPLTQFPQRIRELANYYTDLDSERKQDLAIAA